MEKVKFLNTYVNNITMQEAVDSIDKMICSEKKSYVVAVNVDVIVKIEKDALLKQISDDADLTLVDGKPLIWIAKKHKKPIKDKISGSDLVPELCGLAKEKNYSIFILGGKEGVAEQAKINLEKSYEGINVVGTYSPPIGFEKDDNEIEKINEIISVSKPDLLFACLGCPKQEKWIYQNYLKYDAKVSICAGATVDFLAGNIKRAPEWTSDHGLEWLYRFFKEPKRMFKRYFIDDMKIWKIARKYKKEENNK